MARLFRKLQAFQRRGKSGKVQPFEWRLSKRIMRINVSSFQLNNLSIVSIFQTLLLEMLECTETCDSISDDKQRLYQARHGRQRDQALTQLSSAKLVWLLVMFGGYIGSDVIL